MDDTSVTWLSAKRWVLQKLKVKIVTDIVYEIRKDAYAAERGVYIVDFGHSIEDAG